MRNLPDRVIGSIYLFDHKFTFDGPLGNNHDQQTFDRYTLFQQ
jgi:hypothetical protein